MLVRRHAVISITSACSVSIYLQCIHECIHTPQVQLPGAQEHELQVHEALPQPPILIVQFGIGVEALIVQCVMFPMCSGLLAVMVCDQVKFSGEDELLYTSPSTRHVKERDAPIVPFHELLWVPGSAVAEQRKSQLGLGLAVLLRRPLKHLTIGQ